MRSKSFFFGMGISQTDEKIVVATHLPLLLIKNKAGKEFSGHLSKANLQ
ncbi:MAG: hypothetical protein JWO58_752 [Chitinophagaceae bacterium]|nr:hypothetical protein [Chitinophagaceae bacterium]